MKKSISKFLMIILLLMPVMVFASNGDNDFPIGMALFMEAFVSIHMSVFVLIPLSEMFAKENSKKLFWTLFFIRVVILLLFDIFITPFIAIFDFISVFIGAFIVVPICALVKHIKINGRSNQVVNESFSSLPSQSSSYVTKGLELKCAKCNSVLQVTHKFCPGCGSPFDGDNVVVSENPDSVIERPQKRAVLSSSFDRMYKLSDDKMLEEFINRELTKYNINVESGVIPSDALKRKNVLNFIFSLLVFIFISSIFFHFPIYTYIIGLIILIIFFVLTRRYNLIKYLKKQVKARPGEKISNIIMNVTNITVNDNSKIIFTCCLLLALLSPLLIFSKPRIIYEKVDNGYAVRYYTFGISNFKTATIPDSYKGENIVSLRGNTFSNMVFLEKVELPDTITEIRGQAFKNCKRLTDVNIPENLEYLGGGAFYNAKSIKRIELPDTLTYLGGESFYGAESLEYIKLSNNITEIRGDSFKYCTSLNSIIIPDSVTRIGAHAFYGDSELSEVYISENSQLNEIGSSAFRNCSKLYSITIPGRTFVNERAFKESPTEIRRYNSVG